MVYTKKYYMRFKLHKNNLNKYKMKRKQEENHGIRLFKKYIRNINKENQINTYKKDFTYGWTYENINNIKSFYYYLKSAKAGKVSGIEKIIEYYIKGIGTQKDIHKALKWCKIKKNIIKNI